jgi:hemerythrin
MTASPDPMTPYLLGVRLIDGQHRRLFALIDALERDGADGAKALAELHGYVDRHFMLEEEIMATLDYPQQADHRQQHDAFRARVGLLDTEGGFTASTVVVRFLRQWLVNHIGRTDRDLCAWIRERGI